MYQEMTDAMRDARRMGTVLYEATGKAWSPGFTQIRSPQRVGHVGSRLLGYVGLVELCLGGLTRVFVVGTFDGVAPGFEGTFVVRGEEFTTEITEDATDEGLVEVAKRTLKDATFSWGTLLARLRADMETIESTLEHLENA